MEVWMRRDMSLSQLSVIDDTGRSRKGGWTGLHAEALRHFTR